MSEGIWTMTEVEFNRELAKAWGEGFAAGKSRAMRYMSDEPNLPLTAPNPYRPTK